MKLRTKLFLSVGVLLLLMVGAMYFLPNYFIQKDVYAASSNIQSLLEKEHKALIRNQKSLLEDILERISGNLNALLFMIFEQKDLRDTLILSDQSDLKEAWTSVTKIAGYDPAIGFIQLHAPKVEEAVALLPHSATLYSAIAIQHESEKVIELMNGEKKTYRGIPLSSKSDPNGPIYFALIEQLREQQQLEELKEELEMTSQNDVTEKAPEFLLDSDQVMKHALLWAVKINLIQALTPLFVEGLIIEGAEIRVPAGIARIDTAGNGVAILSKDLFRVRAVFDDEEYYKKFAPPPNSPPLGASMAIIVDTKEGHVFLGNTLLIDDTTFLTLGTPLSPLVKQLALSSNKIVLMNVNHDYWIGFDENGEKLSMDKLTVYLQAGLTTQKDGILKLKDQKYLFAEASTLADGRIIFYNLRSMAGDQSIENTLAQLRNSLASRISLQLLLISLGTMILILIFVGRITHNIIHPITQLAQATTEVAAGHYEMISFPNVGKRKDEVAILTSSFEQMVKEIQDREKIHAILDKVVSKEVADEILKKGIQLGGEDRIISMLFGDIRGFTALTENFPPQKTIQMLNECMTKISRVIEGEGGVIDKYVGDEVMAIYGVPTKHPDHALRAVSSGVLIIETLKKWNLERIQNGEPAVEMGIGVHTGLVVAGNMGATDRLNYTVLGASVNISARLCEMAKANQLIISEYTLKEPKIEKSFYFEPLEPITLKGFSKPINIYQVNGFKWE